MKHSFQKLIDGYHIFLDKYVNESSFMQKLAREGQKPEIMVVACCDSRVDPAVILQADPGDLFVVRNVANIIPPYEPHNAKRKYCSTSAALEFGVCFLKIKHLIIFGHSGCSGVQILLEKENFDDTEFLYKWVSIVGDDSNIYDHDALAKQSLLRSYRRVLDFPWAKKAYDANALAIHLWFFDVKRGKIMTYCFADKIYKDLI